MHDHITLKEHSSPDLFARTGLHILSLRERTFSTKNKQQYFKWKIFHLHTIPLKAIYKSNI